MATSRSLLLVIFLGLVISFGVAESEHDVSSLQSKLSALEEDVRTKTQELAMNRLEQLKVESAMAKIRELEDKVQSLEEEASKLRTEADLHANRAKSVEETAAGHLSDKEKAIQALEEQKTRLQRAERGLQVAESAMLKAKAEAEEKAKRLDALHQAWLPPWAATHAETLQKTASSRWSTHAEPVVRNLKRSASTKAAGAHEYVKPHLDTFHTKVNPVIQEKWQKLAAGLAPHLETVKNAAASSRDYITPHVNTVHQTVNPYVEAMKEKSRPYIEQAKVHAAPHMERVNTIAGPHYERAVKTAHSYHALVQSHLREKLGKHSISAWLATNTVFISGLAAAILALPFATLFMSLRSLLCSPAKTGHHKRHRSSHGSSSSTTSKKQRRTRQADKETTKTPPTTTTST